MKSIFLSAVILMLSAFNSNDSLTGRGEAKLSDGNATGIVLKSDNSFEAYLNKKSFAGGIYTLKDSTFSFTDNGCLGKVGIIQFIFLVMKIRYSLK